MTIRYATYTVHAPTYYKRLLLTLACGVARGLKHREIAQSLTAAGILTPTGLKFTAKTVKNTLKSLRKPLEFPSIAYRAMMKLIFDGDLTKQDCQPLVAAQVGMH